MRLAATIYKELLLLFRDRAGLLVLFLMPAALVIIISLVQENVLKATGETDIRVLFADHDGGVVGVMIEERLFGSGDIRYVRTLDGETPDREDVERAVVDRSEEMGIVIPEGTSDALERRVQEQVAEAFEKGEGQRDRGTEGQRDKGTEGQRDKGTEGRRDRGAEGKKDDGTSDLPGIRVYFDPVAQGSFRTAVENGLQRILMALEMEMKARAFSQAAPPKADGIIRAITGAETDGPLFPRIDAGWGRERVIRVEVARASRGGDGKLPTSVQQNVPAWALFGMFFIVVPLGGALIRERQGGTLARLLTLPVSYSVLLMGKVIAYVLICLAQFGIILLIGIHVMPLLGTPVLEIGSSPEAILAVVVSAALAACGYGILLGTVARTYEQASMFGAVSVVIAAAVGGIMVPVYVMPEVMRRISDFSPLAWGLNALTDIFAREGTLQTVQTEVFYLLAFGLGTMLLAWGYFSYKGNVDN